MSIIAHLDLDAFFAAVEQLDNPELRGKPVVVGGDEQGRGVVATASYEARAFGIRSAMSAAQARQRCPEAIFVRTRMERYKEMSAQLWEIVREWVPRVEQVGIDEGYLDLGSRVGNDFATACGLAAGLQEAISKRLGITCSIGVASCKVVAKIASDRNKPAGITEVRPGSEIAFLAPLPTRLLPGIGPRTEAVLQAYSIETLGQLAQTTDQRLSQIMPGKHGAEIRQRARGIDPRPVVTEAVERKQIGHEETFAVDVDDIDRLYLEIDLLSERVADRLADRARACHTVTLKLRYSDFRTHTRASTARRAFDDADTISRMARELLNEALRVEPGSLRLIGVAVSKLTPHMQLTLPLRDRDKIARAERPERLF